ncbi:MAG: hypothetical protein QW238_06665 [Candidatus Bathyarchaeia archaeon]
MLFRVASRLQGWMGRKVSLDETISYLSGLEERRPELLGEIFGCAPKLSVEELYEERRIDDARSRRRHGL